MELDTSADAVAAVAAGIKNGALSTMTYDGFAVGPRVTDDEYTAIATDAVNAYVTFLNSPKI